MVSHPFSKLPEAVRHRVWQYVGSVPRVVEIHEEHGQGPLPHNKEDKSAERDRWYTYVMSRTRPPALLHICKESRALGLNEIYQIAYLDYQNPANKFRLLDEDVSNVEVPAVKQTPVYINSATDITYRDKKTCLQGGAPHKMQELEGEEGAFGCHSHPSRGHHGPQLLEATMRRLQISIRICTNSRGQSSR